MTSAPQGLAYFLISGHFKTLRLNPNQPLTIGREKYNDLVVNDLLVSRQHSVIQWDKDQFYLRDLSSRNGTYLNNAKIQQAVLKDGDVIKIGGYDFIFRASSPLDIEKYLLREGVKRCSQETLIDADFGLRFSENGFSGDLKTLALIEVVQTLSQGLKTGLLAIISFNVSNDKALIYFLDGDIVHAELTNLRGFEAILEIIQIDKGQFDFQNDVQSPEKSVEQPTLSILLEASRLIDEKHRSSTKF